MVEAVGATESEHTLEPTAGVEEEEREEAVTLGPHSIYSPSYAVSFV